MTLPTQPSTFATTVYERRALVAILGGAAVLRLLVAAILPDQSGNLPDAETYREAALDILSGRLIGAVNVMPGYPLLIAATGHLKTTQLLTDIALSVAGVWALAAITREVTQSASAALVAALVWALYPFSMFYAVVGLTETLFVLLLLLTYLFYYRRSFALGSLTLVLAILTRPAMELFAPVLLLIFCLVVHRLDWRTTLTQLGVLAALYLVLMAPWWMHNWTKYGSFVRLNAGAGLVLYSGNNPMNRSGGGIRGVDFDPAAFSQIADPLKRDAAMERAAVEYIRDNPMRFMALAAAKFVRLWQPWPHAAAYSGGWMATVSVISFGALLLAALIGFIATARRSFRLYVPIVAFIGYTTAIHMVTIASIRYRFPIEPFLVIFAVAPVPLIMQARFRSTDAKAKTTMPVSL